MKDDQRKEKAFSLLKEYFSRDSMLKREKDLLHNIVNAEGMSSNNIGRLIFHTKEEYTKLNLEFIFEQQTKLIKRINKDFGSDIFKTFVKNYKKIASVHQYFNSDLSPRQKVLVEQRIMHRPAANKDLGKEMVHIDKLVFSKFVDNFNEKYSQTLFEEQSKLLSHYISSFSDNGLTLKVFINEEISRIIGVLEKSLDGYEIRENSDLELGINTVIQKVKNFANTPVNEDMLKDIINLQQLVRELNLDGN
jgi:hypothetical protein